MNRSKLISAVIAALIFTGGLAAQAGCASSGMKKPTLVYVDRHNNIPSDISSQFLYRYERFISGKEKRAFKKLQTDEDRQVFIDKFWAERDPNPATPENEEKERIDGLIDQIDSEPFFSGSGLSGLTFRSNGGFRGDMAWVYLLHGEPNAMDMLSGNRFVDLMLWVYLDESNGRVLYAFLFYQKGGFGEYHLFSQESYRMDFCGAINEISKFKQYSLEMGRQCPEAEAVLREIFYANGKAGLINGYI